MNELKKASRLLLACAGVLVGCSASSAVADTVCAWNFNHEIENRFVYKADHGIGSIDASASSEWLRSYSGTDLGAHSGDEAGLSLGMRGDSANGSGFELTFSARGAHSLQFAYRSSATGFHESEVQRLTSDGWQLIAAFGDSQTASTWTTITVPLGDLAGDTKLRLVLGGASSSGSTARFDNMKVVSVPAPASVIALGELGMCGLRGRRGPGSSHHEE